MKLVVIGAGQGGSNIADEFAGLGKWVYNHRGKKRILSGKGENPGVIRGVFAINLADSDLRGMKHIPPRDDYSILLGTTSKTFRGRGAGKVNADGAEQARRGKTKILSTIGRYADVAGADAVLVIATTAGGTGSGAVGVIVDMLKEEYPTKPVYAMLVLPFAHAYEGDKIDSDAVINTATCLKRVIENSNADGVFLVDNQKMLRENAASGDTLGRINKGIADSFMDISCVGGETDRRFIGEVLDANDFIRSFKGVAAFGFADIPLPKKSRRSFFRGGGAQDISVETKRNDRAQNAVESALNNLSIHCEDDQLGGGARYNAQDVLVLLSGPREELTHEALEIVDNECAERVPGASRKKGSYPGRTSDSISVTVILSGIGKGAAMDLVQKFYTMGTEMLAQDTSRQEGTQQSWGEVSEAGKGLPDL